MAEELRIDDPQGWDALRGAGLTTVVDPLVYRAADVFLAGRSQAPDRDKVWAALTSNLAGLAAFFELVVLGGPLPVFDYTVTFPEAGAVLGGSPSLVEAVNQDGDVLIPVRVGRAAYEPMRDAAVAELRDRPGISAGDRDSVLAELEAFAYEWTPRLQGFERSSPQDRWLTAWLYGGLLFGAYAQKLRGVHVLQPKRARILGAVAFGRAADDQGLQALIAGLPEAAPEAVSNVLPPPELPSVLPYLLAKEPRHPQDMLRAALALKADPDVAAYRAWRATFLTALERGRSALEQRQELEAAQAALKGKLAGPSVPIKASISLVGFAIPVPKLEWDRTVELRPREAWGWSVRQVKGDHRKILMQLLAARDGYTRLDRDLEAVWEGG